MEPPYCTQLPLVGSLQPSQYPLRVKFLLYYDPFECLQATPPVALIDAAIQQLYAALQESGAAEGLGRVTQAEWWAHCRQPGDPHQLHFDVDETCLRQGRSAYTLRHPVRWRPLTICMYMLSSTFEKLYLKYFKE